MRSFFPALALLFASLHAHAQDSISTFSQMPAMIDSLFLKGINDRLIPGAVIGVIHQGKLIHGKAYGQRDVSKGLAVDFEQTLFQLGSVGKLFTAIAVLKEVERGRLDLHTDVNEYLTHFKVEQAGEQPVTLHHLLTHSAGFNDRIIGYATQNPSLQEPLGEHLQSRMPSAFTSPGMEISYSNYSFGLAGHLVEISSGRPFTDYVKAEILDVLGMFGTSYDQPSEGTNFAKGYQTRNQHEQIELLVRHVVPAGSISATGSDLVKFMTALMAKDERLLKAESFELLANEQFSAHPLLTGHGYGNEIQNFNGHPGFAKGGNIPGFLSFVSIFPEDEIGLFIAVNTETDNFLEDFMEVFKSRYFPPVDLEQKPVLNIGDLERFSGDFRVNRYNRHTIEDLFILISTSSTLYHYRDSVLALYHNGKMNYYKPVAPLEFQHTQQPQLHLVFEEEGGKISKMHRNVNIGGINIPATFERVPWYSSVEFINEYAGFFPIFNLIYLFFPIFWLIRHFRTKKAQNRFSNFTRWTAISFSLLVLLSMIMFWQVIQTGEGLLFGVPDHIVTLLYPSYLMPLALLLLTYRLFKAWQGKEGNVLSRIYLSLFFISGTIYTLILHQWHFIGLHF